MDTRLTAYRDLIRAFLEEQLTAVEFETRFLAMFKDEEKPFESSVFDILDRLFSDVDAFCADESLRDEEDLDEQELRERCDAAIRKLDEADSRQSG